LISTRDHIVLIDVKCPQCRDVIPVTELAGEQRIDCPGCGENFRVPGTGSTRPKPPPPKSKDRDRDSPRGKKSSAVRRTRRDDDDDDDRERPQRRDEAGSGGMVGLLIFAGIGLTVLAVGFGLTAWLIFSKDKPETVENAPPRT
jgi:ribosomal protein S27E